MTPNLTLNAALNPDFSQVEADAVQLDVAMGVLPDGTIYAANTTLDARAKEILVAIENSGYHRVGG